MKRTAPTLLVCLFFVTSFDCSRGTNSATGALIHSSIPASEPHLVIGEANEITDVHLPEILNQVMGIEDDDVSSTISADNIRQTFAGIHIELVARKGPASAVRVVAENGRTSFETRAKLNKKLNNDDRLEGYYCDIPFENKYWLDTKRWKITVYLGTELAVEKELEFGLTSELLYSSASDDPFVITDQRNLETGEKYFFRFNNSDEKTVVAVYWNNTGDRFVPIKILSSPAHKTICDISITWPTDDDAGSYMITTYSSEKLPAHEETIPLFNSRLVHKRK